VQAEDQLLVQVMTLRNGLGVTLAARILLPDGLIVPWVHTIPTIVSSNLTPYVFNLPEGFLLDLAVMPTAGGVARGQCFVMAQLVRGPSGAQYPVQVLFSDYCTSNCGVGWPGGFIRQAAEGPGWVTQVHVANPGAGVDWAYQYTNSQRCRVVGIAATFTASAAVANRYITIMFKDNLNDTLAQCPVSVAIAASATGTINAMIGGTTGVSNSVFMVALPSMMMLSMGQWVEAGTISIQSGDAWTNIWLTLEQWAEM
jgi:hypothetical protein